MKSISDLSANLAQNNQFSGGRVTQLVFDDTQLEDIAQVEILTQPQAGRISVNPDKSLALVMTGTDYTGVIDFEYRVTFVDGSTQTQTISGTVGTPAQDLGWGVGNHYALAQDADGFSIVESGEAHRKVHISGDSDALSLADIAVLENVDVAQITGKWLAERPDYGANADMALAEDAGILLWHTITGRNAEPASHWMLLERGHVYENLGRLIERGTTGEDPLHPIHITAYGTGNRPEITSNVMLFQELNSNIVFTDLHFSNGIMALNGDNILFDNVVFTGGEQNFQNLTGLTIRNSAVLDVFLDAPRDGSDEWDAGLNRISGIYSTNTDGILIENTLLHHNGWEDGYRFDQSAEGGQPPTLLSHNLYFQPTATDVTFRDNVTAEAASYGAQFRGGAFIEGNVFLDNNAALVTLGGDYNDAGHIGNTSLLLDNLVTSAGYKIAPIGGGVSVAVINGGKETTLSGNIITHLADPNNPEEFAAKEYTNSDVTSAYPAFYDDTILHNWIGSVTADQIGRFGNNRNTEDLNLEDLNQVTIQNYAEQELRKIDATIQDLIDELRADILSEKEATSGSVGILDYFRAGFGLDTETRTVSQEVAFVPNVLSDGVRWDNRLNWDTGDLPGTSRGLDSVDLGGNWVNFGGSTGIGALSLGKFGELSVSSGFLAVNGNVTGGAESAIHISNAGQLWMSGNIGSVDINIDGGRFVNVGTMNSQGQVLFDISGGQTVLASTRGSMSFVAGDSLTISGSDARLGFDGAGFGLSEVTFARDALLRFEADLNGFATLEEFRTGILDGQTSLHSKVAFNQSNLVIDLSELQGQSGSFELIDVDQITGSFDDVQILGLAANQNVNLTVDYAQDSVVLNVGVVGFGQGIVTVSTVNASGEVTVTRPTQDVAAEVPVVVVPDVAPPVVAPVPVEPVTPIVIEERPVVEETPPQVVTPDPVSNAVHDAFLLNDDQVSYRVTLSEKSQSGYANSIGMYELDENGDMLDVQILFANSKKQEGEFYEFTDIDAGHELGFFLVQNGARFAKHWTDASNLVIEDRQGNQANVHMEDDFVLAYNGQDFRGHTFYSSLDTMNSDGLAHVNAKFLSPNTMELGFEDLLNGGDLDYNDTMLLIERFSDDNLL